MKVTVHSIAGQGDQTHERIQFSVHEKCNLDHYMVADTTYRSETKVSNKVRHTHWFAPLEVDAGDCVVLYTRDGVATSSARADGGTNNFLYWGLSKPVWNDAGDAAMLFEIATWIGRRCK